MLPAALIGIHFHFHMVLNVKNRAHAKCFEFAQERPQSPGHAGLKAYWFIMKRRHAVTRRSVAEVLPSEKEKEKKKKDDILLLTSSLVR